MAAGKDSFTFPVRGIGAGWPVWGDQELACWPLATLYTQSASLHISAVANHKLSVEKLR
jgi:hypothetical protein